MSMRRLPILVLCLALAPAAWATTYTWPGAAPCAGTLQACVDGAIAGSRIEIATATPIAEDISLYDRSLTLTAQDGVAAAFGPNHWLSITSSSLAGALNVSISHLRFANGYLFANYNGSGTATYDFEDLTFGDSSSSAANYIEVDANNGTVDATLTNNRVYGVPFAAGYGMLRLKNHGATFNLSAYYNQITSTAQTNVAGGGIFADFNAGASPAAGTLKLHGNTVRGSFNDSSVFVSEGSSATTASSFSVRAYNNVLIGSSFDGTDFGYACLAFAVNNGNIDAQAYNNTLSHCPRGVAISRWGGATSATAGVSGSIVNNVIVANYLGFDFPLVGLASLPSDSHNLINAPTSTIGYDGTTITAPANLVLDTAPRLRPTSPAIDAADSTALAFGLLLNTLPTTDADGLRRFKGAANKADIGAYEFGDTNFTHVARSGTIGGLHNQTSLIDDSVLNGNVAAASIATPNFNAGLASGEVSYNHPFGIYYSAPNWALFNQDSTNAMPLGAHFDVLVPAAGAGSFVHVTDVSSIGGFSSTLSNSSTDGLADRIVLLTQNWTAGGSGLYNPSPVGLYYGGDSKWHVANLDGATMQANLGFNVYAQEPSTNAWRVTATTGNWTSGNDVRLDHPLLDNTPCARPQVTRLLGGAAAFGNFDVYYHDSRWHIYGYGGIAAGEQFHVLIDPRQVFDCNDRIFADALGEDVNDF